MTFYMSKSKRSLLDINKKLSFYGLLILIPFAIPVAYPLIPLVLGLHYSYKINHLKPQLDQPFKTSTSK